MASENGSPGVATAGSLECGVMVLPEGIVRPVASGVGLIGVAIAGSLGSGVTGDAVVAFAWRPRDLIGMSSSFVFLKCFRLRQY